MQISAPSREIGDSDHRHHHQQRRYYRRGPPTRHARQPPTHARKQRMLHPIEIDHARAQVDARARPQPPGLPARLAGGRTTPKYARSVETMTANPKPNRERHGPTRRHARTRRRERRESPHVSDVFGGLGSRTVRQCPSRLRGSPQVWDTLYRHGLVLTANCRGVLATPVLHALGFEEIEREYMAQMTFPTEIVTARKPTA